MLIETLPAAFEMDEILFELREHSAGLNCGRWDYIFSFIKTLRADPKAVMPDRCSQRSWCYAFDAHVHELAARICCMHFLTGSFNCISNISTSINRCSRPTFDLHLLHIKVLSLALMPFGTD